MGSDIKDMAKEVHPLGGYSSQGWGPSVEQIPINCIYYTTGDQQVLTTCGTDNQLSIKSHDPTSIE